MATICSNNIMFFLICKCKIGLKNLFFNSSQTFPHSFSRVTEYESGPSLFKAGYRVSVCFLQNQRSYMDGPVLAMLAHSSVENDDFEGVRVRQERYYAKVLFLCSLSLLDSWNIQAMNFEIFCFEKENPPEGLSLDHLEMISSTNHALSLTWVL